MSGKSCEIFLRRSFQHGDCIGAVVVEGCRHAGSVEMPDKNVRAGSAAVDSPETEAAAAEGCEEAEVV